MDNNKIELNEDDRVIVAEALKELYLKYVDPYRRRTYQRANTVPQMSAEMMAFLKLVERLRLRMLGVTLPDPFGPEPSLSDTEPDGLHI